MSGIRGKVKGREKRPDTKKRTEWHRAGRQGEKAPGGLPNQRENAPVWGEKNPHQERTVGQMSAAPSEQKIRANQKEDKRKKEDVREGGEESVTVKSRNRTKRDEVLSLAGKESEQTAEELRIRALPGPGKQD